MRPPGLCAPLLLTVVYPAVVAAQNPTRTIYVDASSTCVHNGNCSTTPCGGDWSNSAFRYLEDAIECTDDDPETTEHIWVAHGTYVPPGGPRTFLLKNTVHIYGGFAGSETMLSDRLPDPDPYTIDPATDSVLSGDLLGDDAISELDCASTGGTWLDGKCRDSYGLPVTRNSDNVYNVVTVPDGASPERVVLDGFTITGGFDPVGGGGSPEGGGGGIRMLGVYDSGGATVRNCAILYNRATNGGGGVYGYGALAGRFVDCVIAYNRAGHGGGIVGGKGSGGTLEIVNCQIVGNVGEEKGGGADYELNSPNYTLTVNMVNTLVALNQAGPPPGSYFSSAEGGGILAWYSSVLLSVNNCTIVGNEVVNSTFGIGGGLSVYLADVAINDSVIWDNAAADGRQLFAQTPPEKVRIQYSDVLRTGAAYELGPACGSAGAGCLLAGNIGEAPGDEPQFVDPPSGLGDTDFDLTLQATSPCIDAAANTLVPLDAVDLDNDGDEAEKTPLDLHRLVRFINGS